MTEHPSRREWIGACLAGGGLLLPTSHAAGAFNDDYYGAIAYSPSTGVSGCACGLTSQDAADEKALQYCRDYRGGSDMRVVVTAKNCWFALARADRGAYGHARADNPTKAMELAIGFCGKGATGQYVVWCEYTSPYASI